nr:8412_t:CDS:2 [Entrophospora candida]CAG8578888.1 2438_t:CDS:2 [Entrophospora candida]
MSTPKDRITLVTNHLKSSSSLPRLHGKVCIITGAGSERGIGIATAWLFAKNGAKAIYLIDYCDEFLPKLAKDIEEIYGKVTTVVARKLDAADEQSVISIVNDAIERFGRLDVFFANAGIGTSSQRLESSRVFLAIKFASEAMKKTGNDKKSSSGSIITTSSVAGLRFGAGPMDYSASKAAVISLTQAGACELAGTNIRVNSICPGLIETNMSKPIFDVARKRGTINKVGQLNPLRRYGHSEEIANVALFLASDESSYINGQAIPVCGGLSASLPVVMR